MRTLSRVDPTLKLPPQTSALVRRVAEGFAHAGHQAFLVGGTVRDALLGAPEVDDLDVATSASPTASRAVLRRAGGATYDVGERFGTIGAVFDALRVEVTTYRAEAYEPGSRKPAVALGGSLEDDLSRRDFTINAIALDPLAGTLHDPFGGLRDLADGLVRAVGEPGQRFAEDPLRLLRAVRFAARLGFQVDESTAAAARAQAQSLATISRERVRDELNKLLLAPAPARGVLLLYELGLAEHTLPDLLAMRGMRQEAGRHKDVFSHTLQVLERTPPRLGLRWAALLHDVAKPRTLSIQQGQVHFFGHDRLGEKMARRILDDLRQERHLVSYVGRLVGLHLRANAYDPDWTDGAVRRFVREVNAGSQACREHCACGDVLVDLLALSRADVTSARPERRTAIAASVAELEQRILDLQAQADIEMLDSPLDGNDLMRLFGRPPGPWIRPLKDRLRDLVLDGALAPDDAEAATPIAQRLYQELGLDAA